MIFVIGVPVVGGIGSSYAYDYARNEGDISLISLRLFKLFSPGFLFSHLEAIATGVEVENQSLTLVTWGKIFVGISIIQLFLVFQAHGQLLLNQ